MKRSLKLAVAASTSALVLVAAPAAQAQVGPCTMAYAEDVAQTSSPQLVTYTPPATVTVDGNAVLGIVDYLTVSTGNYLQCLIWTS